MGYLVRSFRGLLTVISAENEKSDAKSVGKCKKGMVVCIMFYISKN